MFEYYIRSGQKRLRRGYTTGTCAALAAAGAARILLTGNAPGRLRLVTPKGIPVELEAREWALNGETARCAVEKDGGDDPDITSGCLIAAEVRKITAGIAIDGGKGVGRVTKPGLDQPVGAAAINQTPRRMIAEAVDAERAAAGYKGGLSVVISVPDGERLAERTFNPRLGIAGGISILGTTGIVEPMSETALAESIGIEIRQAAAVSGTRGLILTPGNYGLEFLNQNELNQWGLPIVKCSNFIGGALDRAAVEGFAGVLTVGHIGKLVKLTGGIWNTHSRYGDCRGELFCAHGAVCGADREICRNLLDAPTTDACIAILDGAGLRAAVLESLLAAIENRLRRRIAIPAGAVLFSNSYGFLGATAAARELIRRWNPPGQALPFGLADSQTGEI